MRNEFLTRNEIFANELAPWCYNKQYTMATLRVDFVVTNSIVKSYFCIRWGYSKFIKTTNDACFDSAAYRPIYSNA